MDKGIVPPILVIGNYLKSHNQVGRIGQTDVGCAGGHMDEGTVLPMLVGGNYWSSHGCHDVVADRMFIDPGIK